MIQTLTSEFSKLPAFEPSDFCRYRLNNVTNTQDKMYTFTRKSNKQSSHGGQHNLHMDSNSASITESFPRSSADINNIINLFTIKDLLKLNINDDENNQNFTTLFNSYSGIEEMIKAFLKENRPHYGGMNGHVVGGPKSSDIYHILQRLILSNQEYLMAEKRKKVRARALIRLHLAIIRQNNLKIQQNSNNMNNGGDESKNTAINQNSQNSNNSTTISSSYGNITKQHEIFSHIQLTMNQYMKSRPITSDNLLYDLFFASSITMNLATLESLQGTDLYSKALKGVFLSFIQVFSTTVKSLRCVCIHEVKFKLLTS